MQLHTQIKKYRTNLNLSQEELAEKVYVTRQTISNWENNKTYPDIRSLLLLSTLFNISLDQLIKGDIKTMQEKINKSELQKFNCDGAIFTILLIILTISIVPLVVFFSYYGLIISAIIWGISMFYAHRIEIYKKNNDIQTYKEIIAFTKGKRLDEIAKAQEYVKRPYQKFLVVFICGLISFVVSMLFVWLLKSYIF
ncbi:helix-turn-helix domain-containing protein [Clostridium haemolyticum]|uniref:Transcriptional regulator n=1 Tax=Clostridium haemolyticum NCTC 9693 TaxID=1443114 RepID=A0ABR4TFZ3_CLOHA|nr:helix-turn-helix transcriptional regulator [Clostridium haemolyticum]KEI17757.1 transcriptional regulator [Clostridium haemolyticum NCTC 9693]KGN04501.1 transcriptional regulator [Clostridium haemolyticum NCTC 8350]